MTMISEAFNYNAMASNKVLLLCRSTYPFTVSVHLRERKKNEHVHAHSNTEKDVFFFSFRVNAFWSRFWDFKTFKYRINDADLQH